MLILHRGVVKMIKIVLLSILLLGICAYDDISNKIANFFQSDVGEER